MTRPDVPSCDPPTRSPLSLPPSLPPIFLTHSIAASAFPFPPADETTQRRSTPRLSAPTRPVAGAVIAQIPLSLSFAKSTGLLSAPRSAGFPAASFQLPSSSLFLFLLLDGPRFPPPTFVCPSPVYVFSQAEGRNKKTDPHPLRCRGMRASESRARGLESARGLGRDLASASAVSELSRLPLYLLSGHARASSRASARARGSGRSTAPCSCEPPRPPHRGHRPHRPLGRAPPLRLQRVAPPGPVRAAPRRVRDQQAPAARRPAAPLPDVAVEERLAPPRVDAWRARARRHARVCAHVAAASGRHGTSRRPEELASPRVLGLLRAARGRRAGRALPECHARRGQAEHQAGAARPGARLVRQAAGAHVVHDQRPSGAPPPCSAHEAETGRLGRHGRADDEDRHGRPRVAPAATARGPGRQASSRRRVRACPEPARVPPRDDPLRACGASRGSVSLRPAEDLR